MKAMRFPRRKGPAEPVHAVRRTGQPGPSFNYELFNCNNFNIRYWSWNYRGCWHQTCPPIVPRYTYTPSAAPRGWAISEVAGGHPPWFSLLTRIDRAPDLARSNLRRERALPLDDCLLSNPLTMPKFKGFKLYSFQFQDPKEPWISIYCHYLPVSGLGNLRACCLPWMW